MPRISLLVLSLLFAGFFSACKKDKKDCTNPNPDDINPPGDTIYVQNTPWPKFVFQHWVWEDESTQSSAIALVDDYLAHNIPVDAIIIDSPWETGYNTFVWDPALYPNAQAMIDYFHSKNVKVIVWITGIINKDVQPHYDYAKNNNYFMKASAGASGPAEVDWWKDPNGSLIDLYNPAAVTWFKGLMDSTLNTGIDGWKCDGTDFYSSILGGASYSPYLGATVNRNDYSAKYYRLFHDYSRQKLGNGRVVMGRPIDNYGTLNIGGDNVAFMPKDIAWAAWVGDQDATFAGMRAALNNMYWSAQYPYPTWGSDIGGYREDSDYPTQRSLQVFVRWAQLGAFCPLMENGGGGEHRPWKFDEVYGTGTQVTDIYRNLVTMRQKYLVGYLMEEMSRIQGQNKSIGSFLNQTDYSFMLGEDIFVVPVLNAGGTVTVNLPAGSTWVYLYDKTKVYEGGQSFTKTFALEEYPVYVKQGTKIANAIEPK